jgi:hypothetical protein
MTQAAEKEQASRIALYKFYIKSEYKSSFVDYDSLENTDVIWNGYKDPATGVILRSGILDLVAYPRLEIRHIVEVVGDLDSYGYLKHKTPRVVERVVEVERQPSQFGKDEAARKAKKDKFEEAHNAGLLNSSKHNRTELDDEWNRGKSSPLPLTEAERIAINTRNARIDEVIGETLSTISNYSSYSHARTYERREQLRELFNKFKNQVSDVASAEKLQRTINETIDSYDRSTSGSVR